MKQITVNGKGYTLDVPSVAALVAYFSLVAEHVVAEVDGAIVARESWDDTTIEDGMRIELVHFVGGG
ncbi:sulfur carrier protein ThiS [Shouchella lonarensis]|uniref:Sulfur carrier protein n=1 Tax=Shouchella lonarensis TaxID=1464122 RepID=A0A1G6IUQ1_9BACI|nr:sulfur carrier protein ThiS [Shouchella lonarensis]SDC10140.1 sulfur carrier protein [Shouchella lonarensis]